MFYYKNGNYKSLIWKVTYVKCHLISMYIGNSTSLNYEYTYPPLHSQCIGTSLLCEPVSLGVVIATSSDVVSSRNT